MISNYEDTKRKIQLDVEKVNIDNLINAIPEGVAVINKNLEVIMKNNAFLKLLQDSSILQLEIDKNFKEKPPKDCESLQKSLEKFNESVEYTTTFGVCRFKNFFLECTGSKIKWNEDFAIVLTFREVSNIIKLESEVTLYSKTLKILQGVSHELKTPLNK